MFINLKYSGYNRHGEQSAAGLFLVLMQPKYDSAEFPQYEAECAKCGKTRETHFNYDSIPHVPACPVHGIVARLKARRDGTEAEFDAIFAEGERHVTGCPECDASKAYASNCFNFSPKSITYPVRAIVRYARVKQFGQFMMGSVRIGSHRVILSGSYGSDGLSCSVPDEVYKLGVPVPSDLYDAWNKGGGWNSAGSEAPLFRKWALKHLCPPKGFHIAGNGFAREFRTLDNAQRAFHRLTSQGYTCGVVKDRFCHRVLVEVR